jgi:hypothetical protein
VKAIIQSKQAADQTQQQGGDQYANTLTFVLGVFKGQVEANEKNIQDLTKHIFKKNRWKSLIYSVFDKNKNI